MKDIEGFTTEDCEAFYKTFYSPNNATVVVVGDFKELAILEKISRAYGELAPSTLPVEDYHPEPAQNGERRVELKKPTPTEKLTVGYHAPAIGDHDFVPLSLLVEVLFGGRASRLHKKLVRELELASDLRAYVGPFRDPGLLEIYASAREGKTAEQLLAVIDEELERVKREPISQEEMDRAVARFELGLLSSLETADGKANTIGFYDTVLGRPSTAFERLSAMERLTQSDLLRAARRYLSRDQRSVILVRAELAANKEAAE
jgi:zinc protease